MTDAARPRMQRRAAVLAWLAPYGVTEAEFDKLIEARVIDRITLHEGGRGYYSTAQIQTVIIDPLIQIERTTLNTH